MWVVNYHYEGEAPASRGGPLGGNGCLYPDINPNTGLCPDAGDIIIDASFPQQLNTQDCRPFGVPSQWPATSSSLGHLTGQAESDGGWSGILGTNAPGWLQYGPYTTSVAPGQNVAFWALQIEGALPADPNNAILTLDVNDATTQRQVVSMQVTGAQWDYPNVYQFFALPFGVDQSQLGHQFEFRAYWLGGASVKEQGCGVMQLQYEGADSSMSHDIGSQAYDYLSNDYDSWQTFGTSEGAGWLMYGPNTSFAAVNSGSNEAIWTLYTDTAAPQNCCAEICYLDVFDLTTQTVVASTTVTSAEFAAAGVYQTFGLPFVVDSSNSGHQFTFRVYSYGQAYLVVTGAGFASGNP
jgi:hypothetical protein